LLGDRRVAITLDGRELDARLLGSLEIDEAPRTGPEKDDAYRMSA
jgi:hypothetical protein